MVASVRRSEREKHTRAAGAHEVVVGEDPAAAAKFGPYDLILESLGGSIVEQSKTSQAEVRHLIACSPSTVNRLTLWGVDNAVVDGLASNFGNLVLL